MVEKFSCFHPTPSLVFSIAHSSFSFIVDFNSEIYCIVSFVFLHTLFNDILEQNRLVFVGDACSTRDIFFPPFFPPVIVGSRTSYSARSSSSSLSFLSFLFLSVPLSLSSYIRM